MKKTILHKAGEIFLRLGFKSVTMDDIANELGMSKKTIYKFFPSKDDLVMAIAKHFMERMKSKILPALNSDKNAIEKLGDLINILAKGSEKISQKRMEEMKKQKYFLTN